MSLTKKIKNEKSSKQETNQLKSNTQNNESKPLKKELSIKSILIEKLHYIKTHLKEELFFIFCVGGIYIFYLLYGLVQEQLNITKFGAEKKVFGFTAFLLALQCFFNMLSAWLVSLVNKEPKDNTPFMKYGFVSSLLVISTFLSNQSIRYISYPTQVLAKSCKPIPVIFMGLLLFKKKYPFLKYIVVIVISLGISLFMLPKASSKKNIQFEGHDHLFGNFILFVSLMMDGIMGPFQDNLVRQYKPSATSMMLNTNIWNLFLFSIMAFARGEVGQAIDFILEYPEVIKLIFSFCITSAIGQQFIFLTTNKFGSLNCSTITTTRKFFSILVSIFYFGHSLDNLQWIAICMVFGGLILDLYISYSNKKKGALSPVATPPVKHSTNASENKKTL
ncbi:hypothetical protein RB653_008797 [Dictyostelium firmibasis]|uniref:Uncharacterized protein n=1 Tax=Dictyostelium firmibasis TaxID=79012 RepID=A0AAN7U164_9MYCE